MLIYGEFFFRIENRILMRMLSRLTSHLLESKKVAEKDVARRKFQNPRNPWLKIATMTQLYFCYSLVVITSSFHLRERGSQVLWFLRFGNDSGKIIPSLIRGVRVKECSPKRNIKGFIILAEIPPPPSPSENPIIVKHIASLINSYTLIFKSNLYDKEWFIFLFFFFFKLRYHINSVDVIFFKKLVSYNLLHLNWTFIYYT